MKTVGDFKDAGLVFVNGDLVDGVTGNEHSPDCDPFNCFFDQLRFREAWTIRSFAWRTNTGVKPEFVGMIEYKTRSGSVYIGLASCVNFAASHGDKLIIIEWRPHLSKFEPESPYDVDAHVSGDDASIRYVDDKPVFTQAMADNNELPPIGSEAILRYRRDSKSVVHSGTVKYASSRHCILYNGSHEFCLLMVDYEYEPIQTEREIVTDKAAILIASKEVLHNQYPKALAIAEILYDAGLLK